MEKKYINHTFEPIYDDSSKILILGTFPSVKSREKEFYYGHPQNRFWKLLAALTETELPQSILQKKEFLLKNHIAVWDVVQSCSIEGSSDSSISDVIPTDISDILNKSAVHIIFTNGAKAYSLYQKYIFPITQIEAVKLPSTSPANAAFSLERLIKEWDVVKKELK